MSTYLYERLKKFLIASASISVIIIIIYILFTTVFKWVLPFIIAFGIAYATEPMVTFMEKKIKIPRKLASIVTVLITLSAIISLIILIIYRIAFEVRELSEKLPSLYDRFTEHASDLYIRGMNIYTALPDEITQFLDNSIKELMSILASGVKTLTGITTKSVFELAISVPTGLIFVIILFMSTYLISSDYEKIKRFLFKQISPAWGNRLVDIKNDLLVALLGYIRAQLIIMSVTFVIISIGMFIIKVDYALLIALLISFFDALPIFGSGAILLPWALVSLISGNYLRTIALVILYGLVITSRQILEPKILGDQIGLYPLVTLMAMYIGLQIFGVFGMILGPVTVLIIVNLHKSGIVKLWKN